MAAAAADVSPLLLQQQQEHTALVRLGRDLERLREEVAFEGILELEAVLRVLAIASSAGSGGMGKGATTRM